jgi:hypothetical protein
VLSVSCRDTDNTDHTDKTITHAGAGLDSGWGSGSDSELLSEQVAESDCHLESDSALGSARDSDSVQEPGSASALDSESDSAFDSGPASVAPE